MRSGLIRKLDKPLPCWAGWLAGVGAGFTSFVSHAGGPSAAVYLLSQRVDKTQFQASSVLLFALPNAIKIVPYAWWGIFTARTLHLGLILAPFALLGAWLGLKAHWPVPKRAFFTITYISLTLTGAKLIWDALT